MTIRNLVEGETKPIDATLYDGDGASRTAIDGTALTLAIVVHDRNGSLVPTSGTASFRTAASGTVRYEPVATDFRAANSPYTARWKVTDTNSDDAFYPNGEPEKWVIRP